jgi:2-oxoglutarate dehydrogenase E1 component
VRVARLAFEYRQRFPRTIVIDMVCYRGTGTTRATTRATPQPLMYKAIAERRSVRKLYVEAARQAGDITSTRPEPLADFQRRSVALEETRAHARAGTGRRPPARWRAAPHRAGVDRGASTRSSTAHGYPEASPPTPSWPQFDRPACRTRRGGRLGHGEALAFGSLLLEGTTCASPVRTRAGHVHQRHALVDYETGAVSR